MSERQTLDGMAGFLLRILGDIVHDTRRDDGGRVWFRFRLDPVNNLKDSIRNYVKVHNKTYKSGFSVAFPDKGFRMRLTKASRSSRKNGQPSARDRERHRDHER